MTSSINDLIINTISEIRQLITTIDHSKSKEDLEFQNLLDFLEGDSTFYNFLEAQAGGFGPPNPLDTNTPCTNTTSPRSNFNFIANMEASRPWLVVDAIAVPSSQHPSPKHFEKLLCKFDLKSDVSPEDHIKQFMLSLRLMDVQHEDVVCRLFLYTFICKAYTWFFSLTIGSITSWTQLETIFLTQFREDKTSGVLFLELSWIKFNKKEKFKYFNQRFINLLN